MTPRDGAERKPPAHATQAADQAPHYLRAVTDMSRTRDVVAREDIHAANGIKLLARGAKLNAGMLDNLLRHKLAIALDAALETSDIVDAVTLTRDLDAVLAQDEMLGRIMQRSGDAQGWKWTLSQMPLHRDLRFRLTVMKSERTALYRHSLYLVLLSHAIGSRLSLSASEMRSLMLAALFHDLGEMHTDPELFKSGRMLQGAERNVIHVHPVTSHAILSRIPGVPADALHAVLQHHERLDGSGYPRAMAGAGIHRLARILAVAETAEVMLRRFDPERFSVAFRLHNARFDANCIRAVYELLPTVDHQADDTPPSRSLSCSRVAAVFAGWPDMRDRIDSSAAHAPLAFVAGRVHEVQSLARQAGYSAEFLEMIDLDGDDAHLAAELLAVQEEITRMLDDIAFEIERRVEPSMACHAVARTLIELLRQPAVKAQEASACAPGSESEAAAKPASPT